MMSFPRSLQSRISWVYMLISIVTIGIIGTVLYVGISRVVLNESVQSSKVAVSKSGKLVGMYIDRLKVLSTLLANNPQTINTLLHRRKAGKRMKVNSLTNVLNSDPYLKSVIVIGKDGYVLSNEHSLNMQRSSDMMNEPWYVDAVNSTTPALTSARMQKFSMDKDQWIISMSQEVKDEHNRNLGVVLLDIEYKGIEGYLNDLDLGSKGFAFIINSKGQIVYHKDPTYFIDPAKQAQLRTILKTEDGLQGNNLVLNKTKLENTDWTLVGVTYLDGLAQIRGQLLQSFIIVAVGLLLLIITLSPFIARSITRPIRRLEQAMQTAETGALEVRVPETGVTEVQGLAQHFNSMVFEMSRLMQGDRNEGKNASLL